MAVAGLPATAIAASPAPAPTGSDKPPSIMQVASQALSKRAATPAAASTYPAVPAVQARPASARPNREVFGFAQAGGLPSSSGVGWNTWDFSLLTTVAYFGVHVNSGDGHLVQTDSGWNTWQGGEVTQMITAAHNAGARVVLTIVSQENSTNMCNSLQHASTTIGEAVTQMNLRHVDGINVDYESGNAGCAGSDNRTLLRSLVHSLRTRPEMAGKQLTVDTYAGSAGDTSGQNFFDIGGMAPDVDAFFVMAYELDGNPGPPPSGNYAAAGCAVWCMSPTSPHSGYEATGGWDDNRAARTYAAVAGAGKTILGLPYYGYAACTDSQVENAVPSATAHWSVPTIASTQDITTTTTGYTEHRDRRNGVDRWSTYYGSGTDAKGQSYACNRELYLDDAYSLGHKYDLVAQYALAGAGIWSLDYGGGVSSVWQAIASRFTTPPGNPTGGVACASANAAYVSWSPPSGGGVVSYYLVTANSIGGSQSVHVLPPATATSFTGLTSGVSYSFSVQAVNPLATSGAASTSAVTPVAAASSPPTYFTWFDRVSPGMNGDNIHLVNPDSTTDNGCIYVSGIAVQPFSITGQSQTYKSFPGVIGGPVVVSTTTGRALAAQRVQYNASFNEVRANGNAATKLYIPWYDHASAGMWNDNIHVVNPDPVNTANVTITGPGWTPIHLTIAPGAEGIGSWPAGTIGGPVVIDGGSVAVMASQRVQYYDTFNETLAKSLTQDASSELVFNWYDRASPGMWNDNVHLVNPNATDVLATVSVGATTKQATVPAGGTTYVTFPTVIGGPVTVTATGALPLLASQRVQYYNSFNEVAGTPATAAGNTIWMPWYDDASPGMVADNIHIVNPDLVNTAHVTVTGPGSKAPFDVPPGGETYFSWATIGGPVHVTSTGAKVIASQRVQYYQTFNEAAGLAG